MTRRPRYCSTLPETEMDAPGFRRLAIHGWLNHESRRTPVPSLKMASTMLAFPPRIGRVVTVCTAPITVTCWPYHRLLMGFNWL